MYNNANIMERLKNIRRVILSIGHGGGDPGAVHGALNENEECRRIVGFVAQHLIHLGVTVQVAPDLSLSNTCAWLNSNGHATFDWALEIHKDSFVPYNPDTQARRMGVYGHPTSAGSMDVARLLAEQFRLAGAHPTTWARPDTDSPRRQLAWIRRPKMLSHIIEAGGIQGEREHEYYGRTIANSIDTILKIAKNLPV